MVFFELFTHNPTIIRVPAGAALFSENDDGHMMYVLATGRAEVIVNNRVAPNRAGMNDPNIGKIGDFGTPEQNIRRKP